METLEIKNLGPIKELSVSPKTLTVLVGPQASGKSLAAQVLYFFRILKAEFARRFKPEAILNRSSKSDVLLDILSGIRLRYFFTGAESKLSYMASHDSVSEKWTITIGENGKALKINSSLRTDIDNWIENWERSRDILGKQGITNDLYIPAERMIFSMFYDHEPRVLFAPFHAEIIRNFSDAMISNRTIYELLLHRALNIDEDGERLFENVMIFQRKALKGIIQLAKNDNVWIFKSIERGREKFLPIESISSGQMAGWPIFMLLSTSGIRSRECIHFLEEPEIHLHPEAQRVMVETIACLVSFNRRVFITTHSPFILYKINNMLQAFYAYKGSPPEDVYCLNPAEVAAYRIADGKAFDMMDKETGLLDTEELDRVADELGGEFDRYLFMKEPVNG